MVNAIQPANNRRLPLIAFVVALAALYFGREILMPLALAILVSFLLTPPVRRLESWRLPRIPAVLVVIMIAVAAFAGTGWVVVNQLLDVINQLPNYRNNIHRKIESFRGPEGSTLAKATDSVKELSKEALLPAPAPNKLPLYRGSPPEHSSRRLRRRRREHPFRWKWWSRRRPHCSLCETC